MKLDMSKAYDRVEWRFLEAIMAKLGFSGKWINLILQCVKTVSYRIKINGKLSEIIVPSRGIRQGDPFSPYLFVIVAQGLSSLLEGYVSLEKIKGLKMASMGPCISYLFFADDSFLMFKADPVSCTSIKECLECYEVASGQVINFENSALSFSPETLPINQERVKQILRIRQSRSHDMYLGVPSFSMRRKRYQFGF